MEQEWLMLAFSTVSIIVSVLVVGFFIERPADLDDPGAGGSPKSPVDEPSRRLM